MNWLVHQMRTSQIGARVAPYVIILGLTFVQDSLGSPLRFWLYLLKMLVGLWCIWQVRSIVTEARWTFSWEALLTGIVVCVIWVELDPYYRKVEVLVSFGEPWNPFKHFADTPALAWFFVCVRTLGSALIVPPIEETFYRSFLYRYFVRLDFTSLPLGHRHWLSLFVTSALFGMIHYQWLAGILCGLAFQWLVIRKNRLGDAMTAHAITNFLLGIWIVWKGDWKFW